MTYFSAEIPGVQLFGRSLGWIYVRYRGSDRTGHGDVTRGSRSSEDGVPVQANN